MNLGSTGPPGSVVAVATKRRKGRRARKGCAQQSGGGGGATSTISRCAPVDALQLEDVYLSLVSSSLSSSTAGRRRSPFAAVFNEPPRTRGVLNSGNFCFMNAVAQVLAFLPPFAQLAVSAVAAEELCPVLAALGRWVLAYWGAPGAQSVPPPRLPNLLGGRAGLSAAPSHLAKMNGSSQEDAGEFMHYLLEVIQVELSALEKSYNGYLPDRSCDSSLLAGIKGKTKDWTFVNGKERLSVREQCDKTRSVLLDAVFGGTVENHLKGKNKLKDHASVLVERFFILQVDVGFSAECNLEMALERTLQRERVYDSARAKDLLKTVKLQKLPTVLILQLQRWAVTAEGELVKLDNLVRFPKVLTLPKSTCVDNTLSNSARCYHLVSFIAHRGRATERGHYVAYLTNTSSSASTATQGDTTLTLCNDAKVQTVVMKKAVEEETVYLLFYHRKTS